MMKEHTAALLNRIGTSLRSNRDILEAIAGSLHAGDLMESDANSKLIVDLDTVVDFCIQAGQALAFDQLISEAAGDVLKEDAPLIYSLLEGIVPHLPKEVPEKKDIRRTKEVANSIGIMNDHETEFVRSIMEDIGAGNDTSWNLLPYLFSAFMSSNIWNATTFNVDTGGFNNNIHCLARYINAVIAGNEYVRMEMENQLANGHVDENLQSQMQSSLRAEASAKSSVMLFVKMSTGIILDCWNENRSDLAPKLIFLDQLCEISPHLPRSSLEACISYSIIRSLYNQYYGISSSLPLTLRSLSSPRNSPGVTLMHYSPAFRHLRSDSNQPYSDQSGHFKQFSSQLYEADNGSVHSNDRRQRKFRVSGPLDYSSTRKVKFNEGSTSGSTGPSPLPRFAVSRSGPISYK